MRQSLGMEGKNVCSECCLTVIPLKETSQCVEIKIKNMASCVLESKIKARLHEEGPCKEITAGVDDKQRGLPSRQ